MINITERSVRTHASVVICTSENQLFSTRKAVAQHHWWREFVILDCSATKFDCLILRRESPARPEFNKKDLAASQ